MSAGWQPFNEKHPFGKGATVVSEDNIVHAQARRAARNRIMNGRGTPEDYVAIQETEMLIRQVAEGKEGKDD